MDENFSFRILYCREGSFRSNNLTDDTLCDRIDLPLCAPDCVLQHATYSKRRSTVQVSKFNDTPMCLSAAMKGVGYDDR